MNKKLILIVIALIIIIAMLFLSTFNDKGAEQVEVVENKQVQQCSSVINGCSSIVNSTQVVLKFPDSVGYLNSFPIEVSLLPEKNIQADSVKLDFQMLNMNMGMNVYQLQKDSLNHSLWKGKAVLPVCVSGRSDWQAHVEVKTKDKIYKSIFQFEVKASNQ